MNDPDILKAAADYLRTELFPDVNPLPQRVLLGLYRLVARGSPVTINDLSRALAIDSRTIESVLEAVEPSRLQYDDAGGIIAFAGLSQAPTSHRFLFDDHTLYTWCAFDTLLLPQLLGGEAHISSACPITNTKIRLTVMPDGPRDVEPSGAVMSLVMPSAENTCGNLRGVFCNHVNFLASREASRTWRTNNPDAAILSINEAFELGRVRNEDCFKNALFMSVNQAQKPTASKTVTNNP